MPIPDAPNGNWLPAVSAAGVSVAGISHKTAPLERRERFALQPEVAERMLGELGAEALLLVT